MARTKKTESVPVRIRFKELKNGCKSIYLDIYVDGKRSYEFLKLSLVPETSPEAREQNEHTMKAANAIKAQRILDLANKKPISVMNEKAKMTLVDWIKEYEQIRVKQGKKSVSDHTQSCLARLTKYNTKIKVHEVDIEFIEGFIAFLEAQKNRRTKKPLSKKTIALYAGTVLWALNLAVEMEIIPTNPLQCFDWKSIKGDKKTRVYLTIEELGKLKNTSYRREDVTKPFLFSCFSGLRISDVRGLKWKNLIEEDGKSHLELIQKKTGKTLYLPISRQAREFMPECRGDGDKNIFIIPDLHTVSKHLRLWAKEAGVTKDFTYHVSRHTFATLTLTMGADIYTTAELMGHSDVETTQVYGKIIDTKKISAVYMIDRLFD